MANEIRTQLQITVNKGSIALNRSVQDAIDMSGNHYSAGVQTVGESAHEQVTFDGDVATAGLAMFINLDDTNYIEIGVDVSNDFYPLVKLLPGEAALFRLATNTIYAQADTAPVRLEKWVIEA